MSDGAVRVFSNPSAREKEPNSPSGFVDGRTVEDTLETILRDARQAAASGSVDISAAMANYLARVDLQPTLARNTASIEINRQEPTTTLTVNSAKKTFVLDRLMPYYRAHRPSCHWAYPNYHSLNFFTASSVPSDAVWLYPNEVTERYPNGRYSPSGSFTIEAFLNPRYSNTSPEAPFNAGTILHLSSTYALSLVSGSSRDSRGLVDGYRLLLQLSSSADVLPSVVSVGSGNGLCAFLSADNALRLNRWHHVAVTWGTDRVDAGTGSFWVDGVRQGTFVFHSTSILPISEDSQRLLESGDYRVTEAVDVRVADGITSPSALCVGNFYEGPNAGASAQSLFFAADPALREGLLELDSTPDVDHPDIFAFRHQLNCELHDLSLREEYLFPSKASARGLASPKLAPNDLSSYMLYVPPFFVPGSPALNVLNGDGGVLVSPFFSENGSPDRPFSAGMSFGVDGRYNSLESFSRDFASGRHARLLNLTNSVILGTTTTARTANEILYATASCRLRNLMMLPCDDGAFRSNFDLAFALERSEDPVFVDDVGAPDPGLISLRRMVSGSIYASLFHQTGSVFDSVVAARPEAPAEVPSDLLAVYQRTQDPSSNEVVFFELSSLFYGERIRPTTFVLRDINLSGSDGRVTITLKDDGHGGLYRADCETTQARWNHVGNLFYEEGIALVKSPALPFFGSSGYDVDLEGQRTAQVMRFDVLVDGASYNTSSNPTWSSAISASFDVNRQPEDQRFVAIGGVNLHDRDLNVLARVQLAQPLIKRNNERYLIKVKIDC